KMYASPRQSRAKVEVFPWLTVHPLLRFSAPVTTSSDIAHVSKLGRHRGARGCWAARQRGSRCRRDLAKWLGSDPTSPGHPSLQFAAPAPTVPDIRHGAKP